MFKNTIPGRNFSIKFLNLYFINLNNENSFVASVMSSGHIYAKDGEKTVLNYISGTLTGI